MVRAIDVQQVILQSSATERVQQPQQQHPDMQQRYFELQLHEEKKLLKEKIGASDETDQILLRDHEEKGKEEEQPKKHRDEESGKAIEQGDASTQGGLINIRI